MNHLGHFLLVNELMSELVATASASGIQGRVVNVTSNMHHFTYRIRRGKFLFRTFYLCMYGQLKSWRVLFQVKRGRAEESTLRNSTTREDTT